VCDVTCDHHILQVAGLWRYLVLGTSLSGTCPVSGTLLQWFELVT
jgi:hypothetical protein